MIFYILFTLVGSSLQAYNPKFLDTLTAGSFSSVIFENEADYIYTMYDLIKSKGKPDIKGEVYLDNGNEDKFIKSEGLISPFIPTPNTCIDKLGTQDFPTDITPLVFKVNYRNSIDFAASKPGNKEFLIYEIYFEDSTQNKANKPEGQVSLVVTDPCYQLVPVDDNNSTIYIAICFKQDIYKIYLLRLDQYIKYDPIFVKIDLRATDYQGIFLYRMLIIPSIEENIIQLIVYKADKDSNGQFFWIFTMDHHSWTLRTKKIIYVTKKFNIIDYHVNSYLVFQGINIDNYEITNYLFKLSAGDVLKDGIIIAPTIVCEGIIINSYINSKTRNSIFEVISMSSNMIGSTSVDKIDFLIYELDGISTNSKLKQKTSFPTKGILERYQNYAAYETDPLKVKFLRLKNKLRLFFVPYEIQDDYFSPSSRDRVFTSLNVVHSYSFKDIIEIGTPWENIQIKEAAVSIGGTDFIAYTDRPHKFPLYEKECRIMKFEFDGALIKIADLNQNQDIPIIGKSINIQMKYESAIIFDLNFLILPHSENKRDVLPIWKTSTKNEYQISSSQQRIELSEIARGSFIVDYYIPSKNNTLLDSEISAVFTNMELDYSYMYFQNQKLVKNIMRQSMMETKMFSFEIPQNIDPIYFQQGFALIKKDQIDTHINLMLTMNLTNKYYVYKADVNDPAKHLQRVDSVDMHTLTQIIPWNEDIFICIDETGRLFQLKVIKMEFEEIFYPGSNCDQIVLFLPTNIEHILICITKKFEFIFYDLKKLANKMTQESVILKYTNQNFENTYSDLRFKVIYTNTNIQIADTFFLFFPNQARDKNNVVGFRLEIGHQLKISDYIELNVRPKFNERKEYFSKATAATFCNGIYVQIAKMEEEIFSICSFFPSVSFEGKLSFSFHKCFELPLDYKPVENSELMQVSYQNFNVDTTIDFKYYLAMYIQDSKGNQNIAFIDPYLPYLQTIIFLYFPISSTGRLIPIIYAYEEDGIIAQSLGAAIINSETKNNVLFLFEYSEPSINLESKYLNLVGHKDILNKDAKTNGTIKLVLKSLIDMEADILENNIITKELLLIQHLGTFKFEPTKKFNLSIEPILNSIGSISDPAVHLKGDNYILGDVIKIELSAEYSTDMMLNNSYWSNYFRIEDYKLTLELNTKESRNNFKLSKYCMSTGEKLLFDFHCTQQGLIMYNLETVFAFGSTDEMREVSSLTNMKKYYYLKISRFSCSSIASYRFYLIQICQDLEGNKRLYLLDVELEEESSFELLSYKFGLEGSLVKDIGISVFEIGTTPILILRTWVGKILIEVSGVIFGKRFDAEKRGGFILSSIGPIKKQMHSYVDAWSWNPLTTSKQKGKYNGYSLYCDLIEGCIIEQIFDYSINLRVGNLIMRNSYPPTETPTPFKCVFSNAKTIYKTIHVDIEMVQYDNFTQSTERTNVVVIHAPNTHSFIFFPNFGEIQSFPFFRISNAFAGLLTTTKVSPICKQWLCVFASNFDEYSYIRLYYINRTHIESFGSSFEDKTTINGSKYSEHYRNAKEIRIDENGAINLDSLSENHTIYTLCTINMTNKFKTEIYQLLWDIDINESEQQENRDRETPLRFLVISRAGRLKKITVKPSLDLIMNTRTFSSSYFDILYMGKLGAQHRQRIFFNRDHISTTIDIAFKGGFLFLSGLLVISLIAFSLIIFNKEDSLKTNAVSPIMKKYDEDERMQMISSKIEGPDDY